ncbi:FAD-binding oxidoreductase [Haloglycomyces albus]|uniref:FAD-binding oxidoreductase n=1 Tax=Haloglycomyces albus TaxID=526067 RepID=UPI00046D3984|nr:FAD-linked oxidase C-terminal domain-containing protein [Haloglycomyces albus]
MHEILSELTETGLRPVTDPDVLAAYAQDQTPMVRAGAPLALVRPTSTRDVAEAVTLAARHDVPIVTQGARTSLAGGASALDGSLLLNLTDMRDILHVDPVNQLAVCQAGVVNADISTAAEPYGLRYAPDPGSWRESTIGGNIATGAGGMCCVKYGVTAEYVRSLEVVLASGAVMRCGSDTAKGVAGYDLVRLFCGSEGTLGIITEATVKLSPIPTQRLTLAAVFPTMATAGQAVTDIMSAGLHPSLMELIDHTHLRAIEEYRPMGLPTHAAALLLVAADSEPERELRDVERHCRAAGAEEVHRATDATEAEALMESRRSALHAIERQGAILVDDIAVPRSRLAEVLHGIEGIGREHQVTVGVVAHAGDGNLHPNIVIDGDDPGSAERGHAAFNDILTLALSSGGTVTGEHGVGSLKRQWLAEEVDETNLAVQRGIKAALDPQGILNPGRVV